MRRIAVLLGILLFVLTSRAFAVGGLADVTVYDRSSGQILPVYSADGQRYIAGRTGNEYELRIRNNTGEDILAVVSVDGVNVVTGETASTSQGGYVIGAWRSLAVGGWRKSLSNVAAFYFTDHGDAYATRTGRPNDVGVIGVALFKRKLMPPVEIQQEPSAQRFDGREEMRDRAQSSKSEAARPRADAPAGAAPPVAAEKGIGTGHGRTQTSHARYVEFERESDTPNEVIALRYDTRANLVARGIIRLAPREPNPFPARFVPDPPAR